MTQDAYRKTLKAARLDLEKMYREREELERKIARMRQTVISLGSLIKETKELEVSKRWFKEHETLSEAVLNCIMASDVPLHPKEIQERLEELGYDIGSSNPLASIWSVIRRIEKQKWGKHPKLRWYKSQRLRKYGRAKEPSLDIDIGVWWGDQKPRIGDWERYEMGSTPKQRKTKVGPIKQEEY